MAGRTPKPRALRELNGNAGKRPLPDEPKTNALTEALPPSTLKGDTKKVWEHTAKELCNMKVLSSSDLQALSRYCSYIALWRDLDKHVSKYGTVIVKVDVKGNEQHVVSPQFQSLMTLETSISRLEQQFGLTPASRTRIASMISKDDEGKDPSDILDLDD